MISRVICLRRPAEDKVNWEILTCLQIGKESAISLPKLPIYLKDSAAPFIKFDQLFP